MGIAADIQESLAAKFETLFPHLDERAAGVQISDAQMVAMPLAHRDWHGDWNYTLHAALPRPSAETPAPLTQASGRTWLHTPGHDRATTPQWAAQTTQLTAARHAQREASLHQRRGGPGQVSPGTGRKAKLTLTDSTAITLLACAFPCPGRSSAACSVSAPPPSPKPSARPAATERHRPLPRADQHPAHQPHRAHSVRHQCGHPRNRNRSNPHVEIRQAQTAGWGFDFGGKTSEAAGGAHLRVIGAKSSQDMRISASGLCAHRSEAGP